MHEPHVHHRRLIDNHEVTIERMVLTPPKFARLGINFEQTVDRLRLPAGRLAQAFGGPTRRGAEQHPRPLRGEDTQDRMDDRGLSHARPARDHKDLRAESQAHGPLLAVRQLDAGLPLDPGDRFVGIDRRPGRPA